MDILKTLITDRTSQDVEELKSILASRNTPEDFDLAKHKGAYNYTDWNRVVWTIRTIRSALNDLGFAVVLPTLQEADSTHIPTRVEGNTLLECLRTLQEVLPSATTLSVPDTLDNLTYQKANEIEQILLDLGTTILRIEDGWFYSGELYTGEI